MCVWGIRRPHAHHTSAIDVCTVRQNNASGKGRQHTTPVNSKYGHQTYLIAWAREVQEACP